MDRRMKPLILLLLTALLCLTVEVNWLFLSSAGKKSGEEAEFVAQPTASYIYSENGLWGVRTASGRQILAPNWFHLEMMGKDVLSAKRTAVGTYGMIRHNGEIITPFIYSDITRIQGRNLWIAKLFEGDTPYYHLYRGDGTLWSDTAWEDCSYEEGMLSLRVGKNACEMSVSDGSFALRSLHAEHPVGLHKLTMELNAQQLSRLPDRIVLEQLGDAAAKYLTYLFVTPKVQPDASLLNTEDTSALTVSYLYSGCFLKTASVRNIRVIEQDGFPQYEVEMRVSYHRMDNGHITDRVTTVMYLTISPNAAGVYGYATFYDPQTAALIPQQNRP